MEFILSIWTVLVAIVFFGIVIWAWSANRKEEFEMMANLPLDIDPHIDPRIDRGLDDRDQEQKHG